MKQLIKNLLTRLAPTGRPSQHRLLRVQLRVERLEDREVPSVTSYGGPIIPNVQVEAIFYGSAWTNPADPNYAQLSVLSTDIQRYLGTITGSSYLDGLSQYYMMNGSGQCIDPGRGQLAGTDFVNIAPGAVVDENAIRGLLTSEVDGGRLPAPNGNTLYMVFLPPNVSLHGLDTTNQDSYHNSYRDSAGRTYYYAPIANPTGNYVTNNAGWTQGLTPFQAMTEITSHELVEAISDPIVGQGWYDPTSQAPGHEIADIAGYQLPGLAQASRLDGYVVQKYWSEATNTNIAPGGVDFQPMQLLPDLSNIQLQFAGYALTLNGLTSTGPTNASFSGTWGSSTPVRGWVWVDGTNDEVHIRVYRSSDSAELFDGTVWELGHQQPQQSNGRLPGDLRHRQSEQYCHVGLRSGLLGLLDERHRLHGRRHGRRQRHHRQSEHLLPEPPQPRAGVTAAVIALAQRFKLRQGRLGFSGGSGRRGFHKWYLIGA
jgi:hypothetical protein